MSNYQQYPTPQKHGWHTRANRANRTNPASPADAASPADIANRTNRANPVSPADAANPVNPANPADPNIQAQSQPAPYSPPAVYGYQGRKGRSPVFPDYAGKGRKKRSVVWRVVFWIAFAVFIVSLVALGTIAFSYWQGRQFYHNIEQAGFIPPSDTEGTSLDDFTVDWDALRAINPDTIGWIYVPGTKINYPIVHTTNNEKYLTQDFEGSQGQIATFGAIFLEAGNAGDFSDVNNIIYGHHLNDGSMFAAIANMDDAGTFNTSRTVYILTPHDNYKLTTFSLIHCSAEDPLVQTSFTTEEKRVEYVQDKIDRSVVEVSDVPEAADMKRTFALSTCDNLPVNGRWVLFAYVVDSTAFHHSNDTDDTAMDGSQGGLVDPDAVDVVDEASKDIAA